MFITYDSQPGEKTKVSSLLVGKILSEIDTKNISNPQTTSHEKWKYHIVKGPRQESMYTQTNKDNIRTIEQ